MKRLALFLDGTWNEPGDNTNVWRLRSMVSPRDGSGVEQRVYYDTGVGTHWYDRLRGGLLGEGLSTNIRQAYQWLVEHYDDDDEIYIFGFSRGAFTARSLAGMISKCGIVRPGAPIPVLQVLERYERGDARPIYRLPKSVDTDSNLSLEDRWMVQYSRRVRITFIGVWDTVGALGLGVRRSRHENRGEFNAHFTRLSSSFDHAYHALAIDEHRKPYPPSLWYHYIPEKAPDKTHSPPPTVEQRWFVGAHSNVGGGYRNDPLAQIPLQWIQQKAKDVGLGFRTNISLLGDEHLIAPVDSYAEFLKGAYRLIKFGRRTYRGIGRDREKVTGGWLEPHYETIDESVFDKWRDDETYRPPNLSDWANRSSIDPRAVVGVTDAR
ncbi:MAG: DUF2235 domain-containing protein [Woeseiaceae bacterium]|nr:DUF2235 domain-containing protein [Woeseiaceae bacterium]